MNFFKKKSSLEDDSNNNNNKLLITPPPRVQRRGTTGMINSSSNTTSNNNKSSNNSNNTSKKTTTSSSKWLPSLSLTTTVGWVLFVGTAMAAMRMSRWVDSLHMEMAVSSSAIRITTHADEPVASNNTSHLVIQPQQQMTLPNNDMLASDMSKSDLEENPPPIATTAATHNNVQQHVWKAATFVNGSALPHDKQFFMLNAYQLELPPGLDPSLENPVLGNAKTPLTNYTLILGEGMISGVTFRQPDGKSIASSDVQCQWSWLSSSSSSTTTTTTTLAKIQLMRSDTGQVQYIANKKVPDFPFTMLGSFRTQYIYCETPVPTATTVHHDNDNGTSPATDNDNDNADETEQPIPHLTALVSSSTGFQLKIDPSKVVPLTRTRQSTETSITATTTTTHSSRGRFAACVAPVYNGDHNLRWLMEYIEYLRAAGAAFVQIPLFDNPTERAPVWDLVRQAYGDDAFVRISDWTLQGSGGFSFYERRIYQKSKFLAWNDCYLRARGEADWALLVDMDELVVAPPPNATTTTTTGGNHNDHNPNDVSRALQWCDDLFAKQGMIACSLTSVSVTSIYAKGIQPYKSSSALLLDEFNYTEREPLGDRHNSGRYHKGRWKYFVRTTAENQEPLKPLLLWTHAISRDYDYSDQFMALVPPDILHIRHYNAHWYVDKTKVPHTLVMDDESERANRNRDAHLPRPFLDRIQQRIWQNPVLKAAYEQSNQTYLSWAEPLASRE